MSGTHSEHEAFPWTIAIVDHPPRKDSAGYVASRTLMNRLAATVEQWTFALGPYEDHHGGGLWVKDDAGWLCLLLPLGIEWSAQFCADPDKVDRLRQMTVRVVAAFPLTLPGYIDAGYEDGERFLTTPITTADEGAQWTDSIFNASVPVPRGAHSGSLPNGAGYHHYPKPIVDIDHFRYDDFQLFVADPKGNPAVVVPVSPRGSGDGRVRLLASHPGSPYAHRLLGTNPATGDRPDHPTPTGQSPFDSDVLPDDDPLACQAFARQ